MAETTILAVLSGVSVAMAGVGQYRAGQAQAAAADYNAEVAKNQAITARQKAAFDAQREREKTRRFLAMQRARAGAGGLGFGGSPLAIMEETALEGELDARAIEYGGELEALGQHSQAALAKWEGKTQKRAGAFMAGTTILGGASKIYREYKGPGTPLIK